MATKRGKAKKKNPCWRGYTAMGDDGQIVMKKKGDKMVPACRPIKDGASMKKPRGTKEEESERKTEARNERVEKRVDKYQKKQGKKQDKIKKKYKEGKITKDLAIEKTINSGSSKKLDKAKFIRGSKEDAKYIAKKKKTKRQENKK